MNSRSEIIKKLEQQKGRHLGDLCGWSLGGVVPQQKAQALAVTHGIDNVLAFPRVGPASAYRRAVLKSVKSGKRDERIFDVVKVEETELKIVHAVVRKDIIAEAVRAGTIVSAGKEFVSGHDAAFSTEIKIGFDKELRDAGGDPADMLKLEDKDHYISERVKALYSEMCVVYTADDIRTAFTRAFESWGGIRMLGHGGLWWVPTDIAEEVRAWAQFLSDLGFSPLVVPSFDTEETISSLRDAARESLEGQLEDIKNDLGSFVGSSSTRLSTLESRVEKYDVIRAKAEMYERVLETELSELKVAANLAQAGLSAAITKATRR